jgi:hypothetical protein
LGLLKGSWLRCWLGLTLGGCGSRYGLLLRLRHIIVISSKEVEGTELNAEVVQVVAASHDDGLILPRSGELTLGDT